MEGGTEVNLETYIPGDGCKCSAYNDSECGCGVDWTPKRIYELQEQLAAERALADRLAGIISEWRDGYGGQIADEGCDCDDCKDILTLDAALDAWKEARE